MTAPPERREALDVTLDIVDEILTKGAEQLYDHHLDENTSDFAVRLAMQEMVEVVKWHFMSRDEGEGDNLADNPSWMADEEPEPAAIDSWARGALQIRPHPPTPPVATAAASKPKVAATRARRSRRAKPDGEEESSSRAALSPQTPTSVTTDTKPKEKRVKPKTSGISDKALKTIEESKAKRAAELKAEQTQLARLQKEFKDKPYTYDRNGAVIAIDQVDGSKLPAYVVVPQVGIQTVSATDHSEELRQLKAVYAVNKLGVADDDSKSNLEDAQRRQKQERQPLMLEAMELGSGVTLQENGKTKTGPVLKPDPTHMSIKAFASYAGSKARRTTKVAEPEPEPEPQPEPVVVASVPGSRAASGTPESTIPIKDLPAPPKASDRQVLELLGHRNRLPRDRPNVNPNVKTRAIMPDGHSLLSPNQDSSPVGRTDWREHTGNLGVSAQLDLGNTKQVPENTIQVDTKLAQQLLGR
eukprot:TRINITY_DN17211_c0_g1_i2.p1 TRINITY_DN17211_c0_g1~~TRINITY_DN17211_c0_g1_i2.p1  ORF type:complete len:471 (+),score=94.20 TRINITY_DN17211_c0_g1_i2:35-1447(+)